VEGDYVMVRTYDVGASIDCALKYLRDGRWDVMGRMMQVLEAMFVRKRNNDAWHTLLAAAVGRGLVVTDSKATAACSPSGSSPTDEGDHASRRRRQQHLARTAAT
jgi:hypothetical protein